MIRRRNGSVHDSSKEVMEEILSNTAATLIAISPQKDSINATSINACSCSLLWRLGAEATYEIQGSFVLVFRWEDCDELDFQSLKSMLIILGRPKSVHQAALKLKEIRIGISEHALAKSTLFSIDEFGPVAWGNVVTNRGAQFGW